MNFRCYHFPNQIYFEVTLFFVDKIILVIELSQVCSFKLIIIYQLLHLNTMTHDYFKDSSCYHHHHFTVYLLQVMSFTIPWIKTIIISNSEVRAVFNFGLLRFLNNSTPSIFVIYSNTYFITDIFFEFSVLSQSYYKLYFEVILFFVDFFLL